MAKRQVVTMTDDLDPTQAADATLEFGLDGASYEIDLSEKNAEQFGLTLAPYVGAARRTGGRRSTAPRSQSSGDRSANTSTVRAWAASEGITISSRGRIPAGVRERYDATH